MELSALRQGLPEIAAHSIPKGSDRLPRQVPGLDRALCHFCSDPPGNVCPDRGVRPLFDQAHPLAFANPFLDLSLCVLFNRVPFGDSLRGFPFPLLRRRACALGRFSLFLSEQYNGLLAPGCLLDPLEQALELPQFLAFERLTGIDVFKEFTHTPCVITQRAQFLNLRCLLREGFRLFCRQGALVLPALICLVDKALCREQDFIRGPRTHKA